MAAREEGQQVRRAEVRINSVPDLLAAPDPTPVPHRAVFNPLTSPGPAHHSEGGFAFNDIVAPATFGSGCAQFKQSGMASAYGVPVVEDRFPTPADLTLEPWRWCLQRGPVIGGVERRQVGGSAAMWPRSTSSLRNRPRAVPRETDWRNCLPRSR